MMSIIKGMESTADKCQPWGDEELHGPGPKAVRFWMWHLEDYVKMTLRQGKPLVWRSAGLTEEGFCRIEERYELDGFFVRNVREESGADCDGHYSRTNVYECVVHDLAAHITPDKVGVPKWERVSARQRDYAAEAMGY
jgi:hypothetical protein